MLQEKGEVEVEEETVLFSHWWDMPRVHHLLRPKLVVFGLFIHLFIYSLICSSLFSLLANLESADAAKQVAMGHLKQTNQKDQKI